MGSCQDEAEFGLSKSDADDFYVFIYDQEEKSAQTKFQKKKASFAR